MKNKMVVISCLLILFNVAACNVINENTVARNEEVFTEIEADQHLVTVANNIDSEFIFDIGPRFQEIKMKEILALRSFNDLIDDAFAERIVSYKNMSVIIIKEDKESADREMSSTEIFTQAQLNLLKSSPFSTNLMIKANFMENNKDSGRFQQNYHSPYLTIVPEIQAQFKGDLATLKKYLNDNTVALRANIDPAKYQAAKLYFTITEHGTVENIYLDRSSGYIELDLKMIDLITKTQDEWIPAVNMEGQHVNQVLVVSFGLMGC